MFNLYNSVVAAVSGKPQEAYKISNSGMQSATCPQKNFTAVYSCGNDPTRKIINVPAEASGTTVNFDCSPLAKKCADARLTISDDGLLKMVDGDDVTVWQIQAPNMPMPSPTAVYAHTAEKGRFQRNYLKVNEELKVGEFIGSPKGYCYFAMTAGGLQLLYDTPGCTAEDKSLNGVKLFKIKNDLPKVSNLGKSGYISNDGKVHEYPSKMLTTMGLDFLPVGKFDAPGNNLKAATTESNAAACQKKCLAADKCAGVVYEPILKRCTLKDENMYPKGQRILNPGYEMYVRTKGLKDAHESCSDHFEGTTAAKWQTLTTGSMMTPSTMCKLGAFTEIEKKNLKDKQKLLEETISKVKPAFDTDDSLTNQLQRNAKKLLKTINDLKRSFDATADEDKNNNSTIDGMFEHYALVRLSEKSKVILWALLALILVLAAAQMWRKGTEVPA